MKIVFLNLADKHETGLAHTSTTAIAKKFAAKAPPHWPLSYLSGPNSVEAHDVFNLFKASKDGALTSTDNRKSLEQLRVLCRQADKIMLAAHGNYGDTVQVSNSEGFGTEGMNVLGSYTDLAALMREILVPNGSYRLALIICYAARSSDARKDHDGELSAADTRSSFAFKFFSEICTHAKVEMTARIGAVSFETDSGHSQVRTEAATSAQIELDELQKTGRILAATDAYVDLKNRYDRSNQGAKFDDMEDKFFTGSGFLASAIASNDEERIIQNYYRLTAQQMTLTNDAATSKGKYGKLIYRYIFGRIAVFAKYPTERLLYVGPI